MAVDKLVDSTQLDADLTSVANAIRTKGGTSASLVFPADFLTAIAAIPSGGGGWTVSDYAKKAISGDIVIDCGTGSFYLNQYAFSGFNDITSVTFEGSGSIGCQSNSFYNCANLTKVASYSPSTKFWTGANAFQNCTKLEYLIGCYSPGAGASSFTTCTKLKAVDMPTNAESTGLRSSSTFSGCSSLKTLIIRSSTMVALANINVFTNSPFASGKSGGTLYVPSALISSYQAATNWSTILGYTNNQILSIEGSIYKTQYADGTPIT